MSQFNDKQLSIIMSGRYKLKFSLKKKKGGIVNFGYVWYAIKPVIGHIIEQLFIYNSESYRIEMNFGET